MQASCTRPFDGSCQRFHRSCRKISRPLSPTKHQADRSPFSYQKRSKRGKKCANRDNSTQFGPIRRDLPPWRVSRSPAFDAGTQKTRKTCVSKTHKRVLPRSVHSTSPSSPSLSTINAILRQILVNNCNSLSTINKKAPCGAVSVSFGRSGSLRRRNRRGIRQARALPQAILAILATRGGQSNQGKGCAWRET